MKQSISQKIRLGIFVIIGSAFLILAVYFIGNKQSVLGGGFQVSAVFKNVNGLQTGNNVRFSGITVGTVKDIEMQNDTTIRVLMTIDDDMLGHIRKNAVAAIGSDGLVGSMIVNISPGAGKAPLVQPGDRLRAYSRIASEDMLSTLSVTNENAAQLTADLLEITQTVLHGEGTVARLLQDTGMARDMHMAVANLKDIGEEVNLAMGEVRTLIAKVKFEGSPAEVLLNDTSSGRTLQNVISNLDSSSNEFQRTVENLNSLVKEVKRGNGAINFLATDTNFVRNLDSTMRHVEEGTAKFNENMEALKHNILFRGYFRKKERQSAQ